MTNVVEFPEATPAQLSGEAAVREQIRLALGSVVGLYHRQPTLAETAAGYHSLTTAIELMRAYQALTAGRP